MGLGVGTSPWPEDYELMGVPFAKRGKRIDEYIEIVKGLTTGDYFEFHGEFYDTGVTDVIVGFRVPYIRGPDTEPLDIKIANWRGPPRR